MKATLKAQYATNLLVFDGAQILSRLHKVHSNMSVSWIHWPSFLRVLAMFRVMFVLADTHKELWLLQLWLCVHLCLCEFHQQTNPFA